MFEHYREKFRVGKDELGDGLIKCRNGFLYEASPQSFGFWLTTKKPNASYHILRKKFPKLELAQVAEHECVMVYMPSTTTDGAKFLRAVGAHRRRRLGAEQKARLLSAGQAHQFQAKHGARAAHHAPESTISAPPVSTGRIGGRAMNQQHTRPGRNVALTSIAGKCRARGMDPDEIERELLAAPERGGLPESEIHTIARSIGSKPTGHVVERPATGWSDSLHEIADRRGWSLDALHQLGAEAKDHEVHFPMRDSTGGVVGWRRRRGDCGSFSSGSKALTIKGSHNGLICPWPIPEGPVLLAEGEADAAAALSAGWLAVVATPGAQPGRGVIEALQRVLAGREVFLTPDGDDAGDCWRDKMGAALARVDCGVSFVPAIVGEDLDKRLHMVDQTKRADELRRLIANAMSFRGSDPKASTSDEVYAAKGPRPETDLGNAERFACQHSGSVLYDVRSGRWRYWDGRRWAIDETGFVYRLAHKTARSIYREAAKATDSKFAEALATWAKRSESRDRLSAMIGLAESLMVIEPARWDSDNWTLNVSNGTINLRTGELHPHSPGDFITRLAPVNYDPAARSAIWDKVLIDALPDDATRAFLQRAAGYSLTGDTREEKLFLILGPEATGKSTLLEAVKAVLGDYAATADFESFLKKRGDAGPRNDIARLQGARLVASSESDDGRALADGLVKALTGGDTITARHLYRDHFEFTPTFKLWLAANHPPKVRDDDGAMWRRILRVPFERTIPKDKRDPAVKAHLKDPAAGGPAILAWAVAGCLAWQHSGLGVAPSVEAATEAYRAEMDPLKEFFADCCTFDTQARVSAKELREAYERFMRETGEKTQYLVSPKAFAERLKAYGCTNKRGRDGKVWFGIRLICEPCEPCEPSLGNFLMNPPHEEKLSNYGSHGSQGSRDENGTGKLAEVMINDEAPF